MTLREAIMHIFSASKPDCTLFVAVDTAYNGAYVQFAFCQEFSDEAAIMIPGPSMFLETHLGDSSIWDWFTSDAREATVHFKWDVDLGSVPIQKGTLMNTKLHHWEHLDNFDESDGDKTHILQPFRLLLAETGTNTYNDHNTITTEIVADDMSDGYSTTTSHSGVSLLSNDAELSPHNSVPSVASTLTTATPSTITKTSDDDAILSKLMGDPDMLARFQALLLLQNTKADQAALPAPGADQDEPN
jgi:hypothetical protein